MRVDWVGLALGYGMYSCDGIILQHFVLLTSYMRKQYHFSYDIRFPEYALLLTQVHQCKVLIYPGGMFILIHVMFGLAYRNCI